MPTTRTIVRGGAFALALAGGGVAGALLGSPSTSLAQDDGDDGKESSEAPDRPDHDGGFRFRAGPGGHLDEIAELIGIEPEALRSALAEGQSIADVAEANGVDPDTIVDALVAQATERLEEIEAALPERMTELVEREGWGERFPGRVRGFPEHGELPGPRPWDGKHRGDFDRGEGEGSAA